MVQNFLEVTKEGVITMKIKQQKQIKAFLIEEFGNKRDVQYLTGRKNAGCIDSEYKNKSENQMKTLAGRYFHAWRCISACLRKAFQKKMYISI